MPALATSNDKSSSVTAINANARIDYILRFSKQVVVVIDEMAQGYEEISSQFLASLPDNHNAAYLAMSPKLNDIQVRCRLTEQLFSDQAFDPEQPLATSVFNLMLKRRSPLSIVIEHAQYLSLQILHELSQLVDVAKKSKKEINVVLTGSADVGRTIAANSVLFGQKVSMVSAQTGQLLSASLPLFKEVASGFSFKGYGKYIAAFSVLAIAGAATIFYLAQRDSMSFSQLTAEKEVMPAPVNMEQDKFVAISNGSKTIEKVEPKAIAAADNQEIFNALTGNKTSQSTAEQQELAQVSDVVMALENSSDVNLGNQLPNLPANTEPKEFNERANIDLVKPKKKIKNQTVSTVKINMPTDESYFTAFEKGYVIQYIAARINTEQDIEKLVLDMSKTYPSVDFKHYLRLINGQAYVVLTSDIYADKAEARTLIDQLPKALAANGPWIKSLAAIKAEIQQYKSSQ